MIYKKKMMEFTLILFALFSIAFIGCSSSGSDSTPAAAPTPAPSIDVLPADFDFGAITDANFDSVQPLEVTIRNGGTADLIVSDIALSDIVNFDLDLNGGANGCASTAPTLVAGSSCTVTVDFTPPVPPPFDTFSADLIIQSNDPTTPTYPMSLLGSTEDITAVDVKINQIEACPRPATTVYVSVTDQGGFPVDTLLADDFAIMEAGSGKPLTSFASVDDTVTLSVALLLDYSRSITSEPVNVTDMENAAISFVNQLGANDVAEIIKYADTVQVTQPFTSDKTDLTTAIQSPTNLGTHTALYDALDQAVSDMATDNLAKTKTRRAIIIITDGKDDDGTGAPQSSSTLTTVITDANGNGVPVFTVGLGNADVTILQQLADDTGGTFSDSTTSANLATVYQQLANLLFTDQYILTYTSGLAAGTSGDLTVTATYAPTGASDSDTISVPGCL
jgi:VWFA-related protein